MFFVMIFLKDSTKINPSNPSHFRSLKDVFLGDECAQYLLTSVQSGKIAPEDVSKFQKKCLGFYITAATEMLKRFPHGDPFLKSLQFVNPKMALGTERTSIPSLGVVVNRFPSLMPKLTDIDSQWRKLPYAFSDSEKIDMSKITTDLMWKKIRKMRNFTDERVFPDLAELAERVLSLSHYKKS